MHVILLFIQFIDLTPLLNLLLQGACPGLISGACMSCYCLLNPLRPSWLCCCRVHTLAFPVVQELADMYKAVDAPATVNLLAKLAV